MGETVNVFQDTKERHVPVVYVLMIAPAMEFAYLQSALLLMLVTHTNMHGILTSISDVSVMLVSVDLIALYKSAPLTTILCMDVEEDNVMQEVMTIQVLHVPTVEVTVPVMSNVIALDVVSVTTNLEFANASLDSS